MKKLILTILCFAPLLAIAQSKPKQHIYFDTVKTVKQRIDYSPDTIPVFFKEIVINGNEAQERLTAGFVIWHSKQAMIKGSVSGLIGYRLSGSDGDRIYFHTSDYYITPYQPEKGKSEPYLYLNKKRVTNKVLYSVKR